MSSWLISCNPLRLLALRCKRVPTTCVQGNMDPMVLFGSESVIREAVGRTIANAGGRRHILNVGHGVVQVGSMFPLELTW